MTLSTHVLDTTRGAPAIGVEVVVARWDETEQVWTPVGAGRTDPEGRARDLVDVLDWDAGRWRIVFNTGEYLGPTAFFPQVIVEFVTAGPDPHHIPLLLSHYGYSTYRGT